MRVIFGMFLMVLSNIVQYRAGMVQNHFWSFMSLACFIFGIGLVAFNVYEELISIRKSILKESSLLDRIIELNNDVLDNNGKLSEHCADVLQMNRKILQSLDKSLKILAEEEENAE